MDRQWWLSVATLAAIAMVGIGFLLLPSPPANDFRGRWVSGADTLLFLSGASGTFRGEPFNVEQRGDRLCLRTQRHQDCMIVAVAHDSLVMTSGIATLLHPGDTVRVFRR